MGIYEQQILSSIPLFYVKVLWRNLKKMSNIRGVNFHQMGEVRNPFRFSSENILILCVFIKIAAARINGQINSSKVVYLFENIHCVYIVNCSSIK
jgi:hypothetical protein